MYGYVVAVWPAWGVCFALFGACGGWWGGGGGGEEVDAFGLVVEVGAYCCGDGEGDGEGEGGWS